MPNRLGEQQWAPVSTLTHSFTRTLPRPVLLSVANKCLCFASYFISHVAGGPLLDSVPQAPPAAARSCSPGQYILRCAATLLGDMHTGVSPPPLPPYLTPHGLGPGGIVRAPGDIIAFDQRRQAAFVLCIIMYRHRLGQAACLQQGVHVTVAQHLHDHNPQLRFWLCMALAQLWEGFEDARLTALSDALPNVLVPLLLSDTDVCVRAAAALALGALLRGDDHHAAGDKEDGDYAWGFSTDAGALPHAAGPPASAPASSPTPTNPNVLLEGYVTAAWHMALLPKAGARQRPRRASAPKPIDSTTSSPHRSFRGERVAEAADPPQGEEREPGATSASSSRSHSHSHSRSNSSGMAAGDASWNTSGSGGGGNASAPRSPRNGRSLSEASVGSGSTTGLSLFPRCSQYALPARPPSRAMMELAIAVCTCVSAADASPMVRREAILALARLVVQPRHAKALRIVAAAAMVRRNAVRQASSGVGIVKGGSGGGGSGGGAKAGSSRGGGPSASASSRALLQRSTDLGHSSSRALELDRERGLMMMSPGGGGDMDDAMGAVLAIGGSLEDVSELADRGGSSSSLTGRVTTTPASSSGPARPSMRPGLSRNASFLQAGRESARSLHSAAVAGARQRAGSEGRLDAGTKGHQGGGVSAMAAAAASDLTSYLATPPPRSVIAAAASSSSAGGAGGARLTGDSVIAGLPDNEVLQRIVRDSADAMLRLVVGDLGERGALYLKVWRTIQQLQVVQQNARCVWHWLTFVCVLMFVLCVVAHRGTPSQLLLAWPASLCCASAPSSCPLQPKWSLAGQRQAALMATMRLRAGSEGSPLPALPPHAAPLAGGAGVVAQRVVAAEAGAMTVVVEEEEAVGGHAGDLTACPIVAHTAAAEVVVVWSPPTPLPTSPPCRSAPMATMVALRPTVVLEVLPATAATVVGAVATPRVCLRRHRCTSSASSRHYWTGASKSSDA